MPHYDRSTGRDGTGVGTDIGSQQQSGASRQRRHVACPARGESRLPHTVQTDRATPEVFDGEFQHGKRQPQANGKKPILQDETLPLGPAYGTVINQELPDRPG